MQSLSNKLVKSVNFPKNIKINFNNLKLLKVNKLIIKYKDSFIISRIKI